MPERAVSVRAKRVWEKLGDWYGSVLADQYGAVPPRDWCEVIDAADNETVKAALCEIRNRHVTFPPKFPEFETIFAKLQRPRISGPSMQEALHDYVVRAKPLTRAQLNAPWQYLYAGHPGYPGAKPSADYACVGVVVPADGDTPGYRVMAADMSLGEVA